MTGRPASAHPDSLTALSAILDEGGRQALTYFHRMADRQVTRKSPGDFVSDADREVEATLRRAIEHHFPGDRIVGEEMGGLTASRYWVIDPIDGTSNFLSGLPLWAVSVALMEDGSPVLGGVVAPALGLSAVGSSSGSFRATGLDEGSQPESPPCVGFGRNRRWPASQRQELEARVEGAGQNVVLLGSCALSLLFVATGRLRGYIEHRVAGPWDCAGGIALCAARSVPAQFGINADGTMDISAGAATGLGLSRTDTAPDPSKRCRD